VSVDGAPGSPLPASRRCPGEVPAGSTTRDAGHGRAETCNLKTAHMAGLDLPGARQAIKITRCRQDTATGKVSREIVYAVTSLTSAQATPQDLARLVREHWAIEARHHIRDVSFAEDAFVACRCQLQPGRGNLRTAPPAARYISEVRDNCGARSTSFPGSSATPSSWHSSSQEGSWGARSGASTATT
jgi:hypothetical protein